MALALQISRAVVAKQPSCIALATAVSDFGSCEITILQGGGRVHGRFSSSLKPAAASGSILGTGADIAGGLLPGNCQQSWRKLAPPPISPQESVRQWRGDRCLSGKKPGSCLRRNVVTMSAAGGTSEVKFGTPAAKTITLHPSVKHTTTIVWLHGLGDTGTGWSNLLEILALPHIKWVVPTAPVQPVTINGGFASTAWFDIRGLSPDSPEDVEGIERSAAYILELLQAERAAGGEDVKVAVGGFSQGGALSLYLATRLALGTWSDGTAIAPVPLSVSVCLSGWLPQGRTLNVAPPSAAAKAASIPILMCHGDADPLIPSLFGDLSYQALTRFGFSNSLFKRYQGLGHEVGGEEMSDLRDWLLENFPPPK